MPSLLMLLVVLSPVPGALPPPPPRRASTCASRHLSAVDVTSVSSLHDATSPSTVRSAPSPSPPRDAASPASTCDTERDPQDPRDSSPAHWREACTCRCGSRYVEVKTPRICDTLDGEECVSPEGGKNRFEDCAIRFVRSNGGPPILEPWLTGGGGPR